MGGSSTNLKIFFPLFSLCLFLLTSVLCQEEGECPNPEAFITVKAMRMVVDHRCRLKFNNDMLLAQSTAFKSCATDKPYKFLPEEEKAKQCPETYVTGFTHDDNCFHMCYLERAGFIHKLTDSWKRIPQGWSEWYQLNRTIFQEIDFLNNTVDPNYNTKLTKAFYTCDLTLETEYNEFNDAFYSSETKVKVHQPWKSTPECAYWAAFSCCVGKAIKKLQDDCYEEYYQMYLTKGKVDNSTLPPIRKG